MWYGGVPPVKIIYCYGQWQPYFNQIEKDVTYIIFHNGLPNTEDNDTWKSEHTLIILDDLMNEVSKNDITQKTFYYRLSSFEYKLYFYHSKLI